MRTLTLGRTDLKISCIGLGCMGMSQSYGPGDKDESYRTLDRALELGITFYDTANVYGGGKNESLLNHWLKNTRDRILLATKFGIEWDDDDQPMGISGAIDAVEPACDASLKRLGVDTIDLYYLHRIDPRTPIEDTVGAMARLVEKGKVRAIGLSEASAETLRRAHAVHPISALQSEYSLWTRDPEAEVLPACRELGVTFVPYSPLGRGFLSGKVRSMQSLTAEDYRRRSPRFQGDNFDRNLALVDKLEDLAAEKGCTASQLALAWLLAQGNDIAPIPGTKRVRFIEENAAAAAITLTDDETAHIDTVAPPDAAAGDRYDAIGMMFVNG